jgi:hypothetical protein
MKLEKQSFQSIHEYMDLLFQSFAPTHEQMKQAKAEYRKIYQQQYQKTYQKKYVQISFRVTQDQYLELQKTAHLKQLKVTTLAKQRTITIKTKNTIVSKRLLLELFDAIEEAVYENRKLNLDDILIKLLTIEKQL